MSTFEPVSLPVPFVSIGDQQWSSTNLSARHFRNGEQVPLVESIEDWERLGTLSLPACCCYRNDSRYLEMSGLLYNWFAVSDRRMLAPEGSRIASRADWERLIGFCGGYQVAGIRLKARTGWNFEGGGADSYGFAAAPGGGRGAFGAYLDHGDYGNWWCSDAQADQTASFVYMSFLGGTVHVRPDGFRMSGFSVRCVRNA